MTVSLITGATGFVGRKLINAIDGEVRALSRVEHSGYDTIICDFQSEGVPRQALNRVNTVFHLAGVAHDMRDANKMANFYYKVNVEATVQLANLAADSGVKKFVFISSVKAGGVPPIGSCATESDQKTIENIYGKTKREAELELLKIGRKSGMHVSIIRPSLVYGPEVKGNLQLMLAGIKKGWFPPLPEIRNRRSMIHVDDLIRAILLVANDDRANGEIFIATDGEPYSSREIYNSMCNALGRPIPKWEVPKVLFDTISALNSRIGYRINKLLGDECYSSAKLEALGFKAQKSLQDMNETDF